ncbi:MAG: RagB/SusD family nutrient uptake outer membrane protein [Bacteroidales bacterium]|nr:RagB/SusD family nutrient uptake outer membrane protein [Bacteroidales bacterium]
MKKLFAILSVVILAAGCNFLDFDETSGDYTREDMYKTFSNVKAMMTNVYGYMPDKDIMAVSSAMRECGSDDAEYADPDASVQLFGNGNWSAVSTVDTKWDLYNAIRSANEFLESVKTVDLSIYRNESKYENQMAQLRLYPYQARVLKAFYLFELARRYGDIPVPEKMLTIDEANSIPKTPFDQVIDYIVEECDTCAKYLPKSYMNSVLDNDYGRATKGFAMALKSRALLYAASPLHNPEGNTDKWKAAAKAALDLINENIYSLDAKFLDDIVASPEVIFCIMRDSDYTFEKYNFPVRFTYGRRTSMAGTYPTQNLVDAFQTLGGYDITLGANGWVTDDPDFDITKPYDGRDPRFARTILANGMEFKKSTIETFVGGQDYSATRSGLCTVTGYYLKKFVDPATSFVRESEYECKHQRVVFRYAEILLSYAEAANECLGPDATDADLTMSARTALNKVRANATMPNVTVAGIDDFRKAVQREWRVEFAFEDHRFWDVRRWKIGQATQTQINGVNIVKDGANLQYSLKNVETRTWAEKMYLYPIPQSELFCNPNLKPQNAGW